MRGTMRATSATERRLPMTLYELFEIMQNHGRGVQIYNDHNGKLIFDGDHYEFHSTSEFDDLQDCIVSDLYTLEDGKMCICLDVEE